MDSGPRSSVDTLRSRARGLAAAGDRAAASAVWTELIGCQPDDAEAANALGNLALSEGDPARARGLFERAAAAEPGQPAIHFNLAAACRGAGDLPAALAALDAALALDPYLVQAIFQKAVLLEEAGEPRDAARLYRNFLDTVPDEVAADPRFASPLERARAAVAADNRTLDGTVAELGAPPSRRIAASVAHLTGKAPLYRSEPTFLTVPELPAVPFLERDATPWLDGLEAGWEALRDEAASALETLDEHFTPYVANPPGTALNQWDKLDHNRDWSALFLWRHGRPDAANRERLPQLSNMLETMPLLRLDARAPNAFLSRLAPHTRIPPHHGVTNARLTVHLPLIVPRGCGFRVGPETRDWVPGRAWVFDDTIEHEAWNDSDAARLILIFDVWHPLLSEVERRHLAATLRAYDRHYGRPKVAGDEM